MSFNFSVKTFCAALVAGATTFSAAYYATPQPIAIAGWITIAVAVIPPVIAAFYSAPTGKTFKLF